MAQAGADSPEDAAAAALRAFPPVVYAPTTPQVQDGEARLKMLRLADGRTALFAYSAVDRLRDWWGDSPWVLLSVEHLQRAHDEVPYDLLLLDRRPLRAGPESDEDVPGRDAR